MADPHNDYLERAENYERLAEEAQDPVLAAAFRRLARIADSQPSALAN
jgi:hypothetical protein